MSHPRQDWLISQALWESIVVLSQKLEKPPLSLAHQAFGLPFTINDVVNILNSNHLPVKLLPKVVSGLNNLAQQAGLAPITIEEIQEGITLGGTLAKEPLPPPQISPEVEAQAEWLPFIRDRLLLFIFLQGKNPEEFFAEFEDTDQTWHQDHRNHLCPKAVLKKLGVTAHQLVQPLIWEERGQLAFCQKNRSQPKNKRYCHLKRIALALVRMHMTQAQFCQKFKVPRKELSPKCPFWASVRLSTLRHLRIKPEKAILPLTPKEAAELERGLQAAAIAENARAA